MNFLRILIYFALIIVMAGCKRESFDTVVNISLVSGIKRLKVNPCKVLIWRQVVEDNLLFSKAFIDTIYTDSFGMVSKLMSLSKPRKNEYYYAELIESKWQVPKKESDSVCNKSWCSKCSWFRSKAQMETTNIYSGFIRQI